MFEQTVIPLVKGFDDSVGTGQVPMIRRSINTRITKEGGVTRRNGFIPYTNDIDGDITTGSLTVAQPGPVYRGTVTYPNFKARKLLIDTNRVDGATQDEMHLLTDGSLLSYNEYGWVPRDLASASGYGFVYPSACGVGMTKRAVGASDKEHSVFTTAANDDYILTAWVESGLSYYSLTDAKTGVVLIESKTFSSGGATVMMGVANATQLGIVHTRSNVLYYTDFGSNPYVPVDYTLVAANVRDTGTYAPIYATGATHDVSVFAFSYVHTVNGWTCAFGNFTTGAVTSSTTYATLGTPDCVCIEYSSRANRYMIACGLGTGANNVYSKILSTSLADQGLDVNWTTSDSARRPIRITATANRAYRGNLTIVVPEFILAMQLSNSGTEVDRVDFRYRAADTTTVTVSGGTYRYSTLVTGFCTYNHQSYIGLGHASTLQGTLFIVAAGIVNTGERQLYIAGRIGYGIASGNLVGPATVVPLMASNDVFVTSHAFKTKYDTDATDVFDYEKTFNVFLDFNIKPSVEKTNDTWVMATGSILKDFHGSSVNESGFLLFPEMDTADITFTGGVGSLSAGSYTWRVYYESYYKNKRVRSFAVEVTKTAAANDRAEIVVPILQWTQRANVAIVVYRTTVNPTADTPFYRVTAYSPAITGTNGWYNNVFNANTVLVRDGAADANITDEEYDYIYSGEVDHIQPDNICAVASYSDRLVAASPTAIYPSLYFTERTGIEWSDELEISVPDSGGPIVGLSQLGNALVIFKKNKIYSIAGEGPDNTQSTGLGFSEPYALSHIYGASSAGAILKIPGGIAFANTDGFFLLDDGGKVNFIGKPVSNGYKAAGSPPVVDIVYNKYHNSLHFVTSSYTFIYYLVYGCWTIDYISPVARLGDADSAIDVQAAAWSNDGVVISDGYQVQYEGLGTTTYSDEVYIPRYSAGELGTFGGVSSYSIMLAYVETDFVAPSGSNADLCRVFSAQFIGRADAADNGTVSVSFSYDFEGDDDTILGPDLTTTPQDYTYVAPPVNTVWPLDNANFETVLPRQLCRNVKTRFDFGDTYGMYTQIILKWRPVKKASSMSPNRSA